MGGGGGGGGGKAFGLPLRKAPQVLKHPQVAHVFASKHGENESRSWIQCYTLSNPMKSTLGAPGRFARLLQRQASGHAIRFWKFAHFFEY